MAGLPQNLYIQCRSILLQCREFESYQTLRAMFITEHLFPFRIGLPSADNPGELVDLSLEYLLNKRLSDGRPVLPIFLATLRNRYETGDARRDDLEVVHEAVQQSMVQTEPPTRQPLRRKPALFDLLLKLDFREQVRLVKQVIDTHRVAAFLVHGEPDHGQQLLANRLLRLTPGWQTGQRIPIDVGSNGIGKSSHSLWRQVANKLDIPANTEPYTIADKICKWWQTQDVIFIFYTVDYMPPDLLSAWIEDFWQPLVKVAQENLHLTQHETRLLLFLVDYSGCVCEWDIVLAQEADESTYPHVPLHLPPARRFPPDDLDFWIDIAAEALPAGVTAQTILEASDNGIPQLVYNAICEQSGLSWEGELAKWLI